MASTNGAIRLCGCMPMMFKYSYFQNQWSRSFNKSFRFEHLVATGHKFHCAMLLNHNLGCFQVLGLLWVYQHKMFFFFPQKSLRFLKMCTLVATSNSKLIKICFHSLNICKFVVVYEFGFMHFLHVLISCMFCISIYCCLLCLCMFSMCTHQ